MKKYGFDDPTDSMAAAERADMTEALLRGDLSREDYDTILLITQKKNQYEKETNIINKT